MTRITLPGERLATALVVVEPFASRDATLPSLNVVRLMVWPGQAVLAATNRYALGEYKLVNTGRDPWELGELSLPYQVAADWVKRTRKLANDVTISADGDKVTLQLPTGDTNTITVATEAATWMPGDHRQFFSAPDDPGQHVTMQFAVPNVLDVLTKVFKGSRGHLRFQFGATPARPVLVTCADMPEFRAAVMPVVTRPREDGE